MELLYYRLLFPFVIFFASAFFPVAARHPAADSLQEKGQRCLFAGGYAGYCLPSGDLSNDYGGFGEAGGSIQYLNRAGFLFGLEGGFLFGGNVKKDPIPNLRNPDGTVSGTDGNDAVFKVFQRGTMLPVLRAGYRFRLKDGWAKGNQLGGITLSGSCGWLRHYTYIQDLSKKSPQFADKYRIGYDRLAAGIFTGLWLGYLYLSDNGRLNLHLEAGYGTGFTKTARYSFADGSPAGISRKDNIFQLRLKFCFAVRSRSQSTVYYY